MTKKEEKLFDELDFFSVSNNPMTIGKALYDEEVIKTFITEHDKRLKEELINEVNELDYGDLVDSDFWRGLDGMVGYEACLKQVKEILKGLTK